jgi:hypothetical protein
MLSRYLTSEFAIVAIVCIAALFLFPAMHGPYSAVHGPVTALLSIRAKVKLRLAMALTTLLLLNRLMVAFCKFARPVSAPQEPFLHLTPSEQLAALRC